MDSGLRSFHRFTRVEFFQPPLSFEIGVFTSSGARVWTVSVLEKLDLLSESVEGVLGWMGMDSPEHQALTLTETLARTRHTESSRQLHGKTYIPIFK